MGVATRAISQTTDREQNLEQVLKQLTTEFAAGAAELDRDGTFPHANLRRLHEHGLLAYTVPANLGGGGATLPEARMVIAAVARGEPSTALILVMQYLQQAFLQNNRAWPEHLRLKVAGDAVRDGALINSLRVEPELGTPARGGLPQTRARRTPEGWRISGRKIYSTGSPGLTWFSVWASSDDEVPEVGAWLVHRDTPGIRIEETWDHLGMRSTGSHDVVFEDVLVPFEQRVDTHPFGSAPPTSLEPQAFLWMSVLLSSLYDAIARSARDWLVEWLRKRTPANLGAPLASLPRFQEIVGRINALLFSNQLLLDSAQDGRISQSQSPQIKYLVTTQAIAAVELAIEAAGNPGLSRSNPLQRHYRDVLCSRIHTPQNDSVLVAIGKAALL